MYAEPPCPTSPKLFFLDETLVADYSLAMCSASIATCMHTWHIQLL